jgi:hypothetical protein
MQSYNEPINRPSGQGIGLKYCKHLPYKRCFHDSCSFLDALGNVRVCKFHPNPHGFFRLRVVKEMLK